jgi:hypothetical protein
VVKILIAAGILAVAYPFVRWERVSTDQLELTIRLTDSKSGASLVDGFIGVSRTRTILEREDLGRYLRGVATLQPAPPHFNPVAAAEIDSPTTTVHATVAVRRVMIGPFVVAREPIAPVDIVVFHPRMGRHRVPVPMPRSIEPLDEEESWQLDLGDVSIP